MTGYYYLHTNGSLIYQHDTDSGQAADYRESDFVRHFWPFDIENRETAWNVLVEGSAIGVGKDRIDELASMWMCDDEDAAVYAERLGIKLYMDGNAWCSARQDAINLQESPHGFGETALEAMADLCKQLGMRAAKMWGPTFKSLVK